MKWDTTNVIGSLKNDRFSREICANYTILFIVKSIYLYIDEEGRGENFFSRDRDWRNRNVTAGCRPAVIINELPIDCSSPRRSYIGMEVAAGLLL